MPLPGVSVTPEPATYGLGGWAEPDPNGAATAWIGVTYGWLAVAPMTDDERSHLFRLAGQAEPGPGTIDRHITPSLQRLLDRLTDVPVMVVDAAAEIVAANPLATAMIGDLSGVSWRERSIPWRHFTGGPSRIVRTAEQQREAEATMVAELRDAVGRFRLTSI